MGHSNIATTQIYLHRDATEATAGQDNVPDLSPGEKPPPKKPDIPPEKPG
jgi:hypothetical protein